ncbi:MAG: NERD domain-containing protein [Gammaproteobacteria bacterium]|nr:NERD domain-containing protein [Gammaproteobacteria bacterium]
MFETVREAIYKWKLNRKLNCLFTDIYVDNYDDEFHHIDYFMVSGKKLVVVKYFDYIGNIYGSENITEWTQTIGHSGFKFKNPLRDLRELVNQIRDKIPEFDIVQYCMFSDKCNFPKQMPEAVITRSQLLDMLETKIDKHADIDCEALKQKLGAVISN